MDEPRTTGRVAAIDISGAVFAWEGDGPVFISMIGAPGDYLALFPSPEKLCAFFAKIEIGFESIKQVVPGEADEFLGSFKDTEIGIIAEPWFTPEGRVRFLMLKPAGAAA